MERGTWEQRGSEAGNSPVVLLVEGGVRGARGEGAGSEKEMRWRRREMEGQREVQELLVLEESRGRTLERKQGKIKVKVNLPQCETSHKNLIKYFKPNTQRGDLLD